MLEPIKPYIPDNGYDYDYVAVQQSRQPLSQLQPQNPNLQAEHVPVAAARTRRRPNLRLHTSSQPEIFNAHSPSTSTSTASFRPSSSGGRYNTRGQSLAYAPVNEHASPALLPAPILDLDPEDNALGYTANSNDVSMDHNPLTRVDRCETTPSTWPRKRPPLQDVGGLGACDTNRCLAGIAQAVARTGPLASERKILQFLLSEGDDDDGGEGEMEGVGNNSVRGGDGDTSDEDAEGESDDDEAMDVEGDSGTEGDVDDGGDAMDADEDEDDDEDDEEEDLDDDEDEAELHELRTLYRYMNPSKYGHVDLAHPLCSPIDDIFGSKKSKGFFDDENEFMF